MQSNTFKQLGKKQHTLITFIAFTIMFVAMIPSSAYARGGVHIDLPGISVSVRDNYYNTNSYRRNSNKYSHKQYRSSNKNRARKVYRNRSYNNNYNSRGYYNYGNQYNTYNKGYNSGYKNGYKKSYRNYNQSYNQSYNQGRRYQVCPEDGYSRYNNNQSNCYSHNDHFHCD